MTSATLLGRRLADLRRERDRTRSDGPPGSAPAHGPRPIGPEPGSGEPAAPPLQGTRAELAERSETLARRLAQAVDGEWVRSAAGGYVRVDREPVTMAVDRGRLGRLPDAAPADVPLVCLDTETTGLATGTGTVAFLIGLGWWTEDRFHQVQFLMPDHAEEPALLDAVAAAIPAEAWLVTYNGRGFDWPLLVARYRMTGRPAPVHAGHLDLLPFVRRVFRHRMTDARLRTVEAELLGLHRGADVDGWAIPGRYLDFLRGGPVGPIADVVRHNHEDVRSLARLLGHIERALGDGTARRSAPIGDLAGLARAYRRHDQPVEALDCLDIALEAPVVRDPRAVSWTTLLTTRADDTRQGEVAGVAGRSWADRTERGTTRAPGRDDLLVDRAHLLRRLCRVDEALTAWRDVARGGGPGAGLAWVEVAKILEHRRRDLAGALEACTAAGRIAERSRALGHVLPGLEADLRRRRRRLLRRLARAPGSH